MSMSMRSQPLMVRYSRIFSIRRVEWQRFSLPMERASCWVSELIFMVTASSIASRFFLSASAISIGSFSRAYLLSRYLA